MRIHGEASLPTLIYLPGLHGDWTLVTSFRVAVAGQVRFVEFTYPRTLTWSLADYAAAIETCLLEHGITRGWLLGESFGSQIIWPLLEETRGRVPEKSLDRRPARFVPDGIILAGGFVRHPVMGAVRLAGWLCEKMPLSWVSRFLLLYARFARFRHRHAPEMLAGIREFVARRTELDKQAATWRLRLLAENDPRPTARQLLVPVHYLSGFWDPIVPWPFVRAWLQRHCPAFRGSRILWQADHTVLAIAPKASARQVLAWIRSARVA